MLCPSVSLSVRQIYCSLLLVASLSFAGCYNTNDIYDGSYNYGISYQMELNACSDSVVIVTYMTISCDSPYTFYYGNGAHRDSPICDYGDKSTLTVGFDVADDLQEGDEKIFFTMAAYDDNKNLLASTYPESLCDDYVGYECTKQGSYSFIYRLKFGTPNGGNRTKFIPWIQMAFSTNGDSGYNLGAVNLECQPWDQDQPVYISWREPATTQEKLLDFFTNNGMLLGTMFLLSSFSFFICYVAIGDRIGRIQFVVPKGMPTIV